MAGYYSLVRLRPVGDAGTGIGAGRGLRAHWCSMARSLRSRTFHPNTTRYEPKR